MHLFKKQPELTIAKSPNGVFYLKNNPGNGEKHLYSCQLHSEYISNNIFEKGWTEEGEYFRANLNNSVFGIKSQITSKKRGDKKEQFIM